MLTCELTTAFDVRAKSAQNSELAKRDSERLASMLLIDSSLICSQQLHRLRASGYTDVIHCALNLSQINSAVMSDHYYVLSLS